MGRSTRNLRTSDASAFGRKWNELLEEIDRRPVTVVAPLYLSEGASGTTLYVRRQKPGESAAETCDAFKINLTEVADPAYTMLLTPGAINQAVPSNILTPIAYNSTTDRYVKLKVTTDGFALTGVTVALESTPTDPISTTVNAAPTSFDILIGVISQGVITQVWTDCNMLATLTLALVESKTIPEPGTSPYNFYYTWVVTGD